MINAHDLKYFKMALSLVNINIDDKCAELILAILNKLKERGDHVDLHDIAFIEAVINEKYKPVVKSNRVKNFNKWKKYKSLIHR